jgi:hypothetical protein
MRLRLPVWTPLLLVALLVAAWPIAALASGGGPKPEWVHSDEGDPVPNGDPVNAAADDVAAELAQAGVTSVGLETAPWRGAERATDNPASTSSGSKIKLVYAYAADQPDRFGGWAGALQANVAVIERFLSAQDGGTKAIRFDMGTRCGGQFVDIQTVQLPGPRSGYVDNFSAIESAVQRAIAGAAGPRDAIVLADGLSGSTQEYGLGETVMGASGETPGAANVHNRGGFTSVLFSRNGAAAPGNAKWGWWPEGMLHEMTHNLGAVQWGAPHSTEPRGQTAPQYGHCWQGADVMCYVEDGGASHPMQQDCAGLPGAIPQNYDCGRDDYFNPAPAPRSYLATHWNVYRNDFLAPCSAIAPACGGGMAGLVPEPPVATAGPQVIGAPRRGDVVRASGGSWRNGPVTYTYRWQRQRGSRWITIRGARRASYRATRTDRGRRLRVQVIAANRDGRASAASPPTARVADGMVGHAETVSSSQCRRPKGRARRLAATCRGHRTSRAAAKRRR